jgi:hypothetical protein
MTRDDRRTTDRRPSIMLESAVSAAQIMGAIERERAALAKGYPFKSCVGMEAPLNAKHIGDHYEAMRKGH